MKRSTFLAFALFLPITIMAQRSTSAQVYTEDIDRFWIAYDSAHTTTDTLKQQDYFQRLYINQGTEGLHAFMKARDYDAKVWVDLINKYPKFWTSIRENTLEVKTERKAIEAAINRFRVLYPQMRPAKMYFTVGGLRSGGTTTDDMVLVGTEIATADQNTDASELSAWLKGVFRSQDASNLVALNVHEYVHTQQKGDGNTVLAQSIKEGAADFVAELVTGKPNTSSYVIYGRQHEADLKDLFKIDMFSSALSKWMYNGGSVEQADLGYFIGYSICKSYYKNAANKKAALRQIIELNYADEEAVQKFLKASNYYASPIDKESLLTAFAARVPYVVSLSPDINLHTEVPSSLTEITVNFSKPMGKGMSISYGEGGKDTFPLTAVVGFSEDRKALKLKVSLQPNKVYDFKIEGRGFKSEDGYPLKDYHVHFSTAKN